MDIDLRRFRLHWIAYILFFVVATTLSTAGTIAFLVKSGQEVIVPRLVGRTIAAADHLLQQQQLSKNILGYRYSDRFSRDIILEQTVPSGENVQVGRTVGVYLSRGPRERTTPNLRGLRLEAAQTVLGSSELKGVIQASACSDRLPIQHILGQDPAPGSLIAHDVIRLLVSTGSCTDRYVLGSILGLPVDQVVNVMSRYGFLIRTVSYETASDMPAGHITATEPSVGSVVRPFDPIRLTVSAAEVQVASESPEEIARLVYIPIRLDPGLFRREAVIVIDEGSLFGMRRFSLLLHPGQYEGQIFRLSSGGEVALEIDGREIWRKIF